MRTVRAVTTVLVAGLLVGCLVTAVRAQDEKDDAASKQPAKAYRLEFSLSEVEDGKKINSRNYTMVVQAPGFNKLRIGARLPVETGTVAGSTQLQYLDMGMNIDCKINREQDGVLSLATMVEHSGLGLRDERTGQPIVQQMRAEVQTLVPIGKPTLITGMDDPASKRRFELEVTATRAK